MDNHSFEFNLNGEGSKVSKQSVEEVLKDDLNRSDEGYILGDYMSVSDGKISFNGEDLSGQYRYYYHEEVISLLDKLQKELEFHFTGSFTWYSQDVSVDYVHDYIFDRKGNYELKFSDSSE